MSNGLERVVITNITKRKRFRLRGGYLYIEKGTYKFFVNNFFELQPSNNIELTENVNFVKVKIKGGTTVYSFEGDVYFNDYKLKCIHTIPNNGHSWDDKINNNFFEEFENGFCTYCGKENSHTISCYSAREDLGIDKITEGENILKNLEHVDPDILQYVAKRILGMKEPSPEIESATEVEQNIDNHVSDIDSQVTEVEQNIDSHFSDINSRTTEQEVSRTMKTT